KPSRKLEEKRMPSLKRVDLNPLLTQEYLARGTRPEVRDTIRGMQFLAARAVAEGATQICPPEKRAADLAPAKPMGRTKIYKRVTSAAERKAASRAMNRVKASTPNGRVRPGADRRNSYPPPTASGFFVPTRPGTIRVSFTDDCSSRITLKGGQMMLTPVPTPRGATPLVAEMQITDEMIIAAVAATRAREQRERPTGHVSALVAKLNRLDAALRVMHS